MNWQVISGDCIEKMRELPDESIDSVVTDPPYGIGFMGHEWDQPGEYQAESADHGGSNVSYGGAPHPAMEAGRYDRSLTANQKFQRWTEAWAREAFRVLKPGGHLLSFAGTRTYHRMTSGIEDAGFEVRDQIAWLFGSGFPKSLDISKAIDKRRDDVDDVRVICRWLRDRIEHHPEHAIATIAEHFGFHPRMVEHWAARDTDSQPALPTLEQWDELRKLLSFDDSIDAEVLRLNLRKGEPGEAWADRPVTGTVEEWANRSNYALTSADGLRRDVPVSDEAIEWRGWGTALKPAFEPIAVARKPLIGTHVDNVLEHGTGALNIDRTRIGFLDEADEAESKNKNRHADFGTEAGGNAVYGDYSMVDRQNYDADGRWPANVALDPAAAAILDQLAGDTVSRFFYCAKTSSAERAAGGVKNVHPTVKPIELMRWLCRLVTPPRGVVLDPFNGSGSTGCAAVLDGFDYIGIERETEYVAIAESRIEWWAAHPEGVDIGDRIKADRKRAQVAESGQIDLFGAAA